MPAFVPSIVRPKVKIDPELRDNIIFDYEAFYELARTNGQSPQSIARYSTHFRARDRRDALCGFYHNVTQRSQIFVPTCIRRATGSPKDIAGARIDGTVQSVLNYTSIHEYGHHVYRRSLVGSTVAYLMSKELGGMGVPAEKLPNERDAYAFAASNADALVVHYQV